MKHQLTFHRIFVGLAVLLFLNSPSFQTIHQIVDHGLLDTHPTHLCSHHHHEPDSDIPGIKIPGEGHCALCELEASLILLPAASALVQLPPNYIVHHQSVFQNTPGHFLYDQHFLRGPPALA